MASASVIPKVLITLFFFVFLAAGLAVTGWGVMTIWRANASGGWPTVVAVIERSEFVSDQGRESAKYSADLTYSYRVDGRNYQGTAVSVGQSATGSPRNIREILNAYPEGSETTAYYDPRDPGAAVLRPVVPADAWFIALFGLPFILVGAGGPLLIFLASDDGKLRVPTRPKAKSRWWVGYMVGAAFFLVGMVVLWFVGPKFLDAGRSVAWPTADGRVLLSMVEVHTDDDGTTYGPEVAYEYTVDGVTYAHNRIWYGQYSSGDRGMAAGVVRDYAKGQPVAVRYKPNDPSEAVLQPGRHVSSYIGPAIGTLLAGIGAAVWFAMLWRLLRADASD